MNKMMDNNDSGECAGKSVATGAFGLGFVTAGAIQRLKFGLNGDGSLDEIVQEGLQTDNIGYKTGIDYNSYSGNHYNNPIGEADVLIGAGALLLAYSLAQASKFLRNK